MKPWKQQNGEPDTDSRSKGAKEFLEKILGDTTGIWDQVVGVANSVEAKKQFRKLGDLDVPPEVTVICISPELAERDKLVVFIMPPKGSTLSNIDPLDYWVAAWPPYPHLESSATKGSTVSTD
jgi:hypothetical protein